jgi:hypothetical protein
MDSVIQMVLDGNWSDLTKYTEKQAAIKIQEKIQAKKAIIIDHLNAGFDSK